jgi:membrane associated rhomboid family serine protease
VEFYLGWIRYLIVYFISGLGAISLFAVFAMFLGEGDELLVGASAAIMGLMGATFMILWRGWRQEQSTIAQERLRLVILIISLQIMFDVSLAKVSFIGHFCGLIFGIFSTFIILAINKHKMGIVNNNLK